MLRDLEETLSRQKNNMNLVGHMKMVSIVFISQITTLNLRVPGWLVNIDLSHLQSMSVVKDFRNMSLKCSKDKSFINKRLLRWKKPWKNISINVNLSMKSSWPSTKNAKLNGRLSSWNIRISKNSWRRKTRKEHKTWKTNWKRKLLKKKVWNQTFSKKDSRCRKWLRKLRKYITSKMPRFKRLDRNKSSIQRWIRNNIVFYSLIWARILINSKVRISREIVSLMKSILHLLWWIRIKSSSCRPTMINTEAS